MEIKTGTPPHPLVDESSVPLIQAYYELSQLKGLYRQGWLLRGVPRERCESVAEHSFGVAVLALWLAEAHYPHLDRGKVLRMALLHDFGEVYAGDITPTDGVSRGEKAKRELESVKKVFIKLPGGDTYLDLWQEFETGESPEARFIRQVDRLEMALQAGVYQQQGLENMEEFLNSARQELSDAPLLDLMAEIETLSRQSLNPDVDE